MWALRYLILEKLELFYLGELAEDRSGGSSFDLAVIEAIQRLRKRFCDSER